jgi:nucleotide-binding universal stress UspA family protein
MSEHGLPQRIFLATDLSARCDRALARAALLSSHWGSRLIVAHVVHAAEVARRNHQGDNVPSWRRTESWTQTLQRALSDDLAAEGVTATSRVIVGSPAEAVQQAVAEDLAELIVLGTAKDARMERIQLGSTVDALLRDSRVPLLNVRGRARAAYRHVLVATDFSEPSLYALRLAARWFEGAHLTLFHAYVTSGVPLGSGVNADDAMRAALTRECADYLARADLPAEKAAGVHCVIERGQPEALLSDYISSTEVDLVVLGSRGRTGLARALLGSTAETVLHALDCDTLIVRGE